MTDVSDRFAFPLLQAGQAQKELFHNEALVRLDTLLHPAVATIAANVPPADPATGGTWIVGPSPVDAWSGKAGQIASWTRGGWRFVRPVAGLKVWLLDADCWAWHDGKSWSDKALPSNGLMVAGVQVVGAQRPPIATPTGGSMIDTEARAAISLILAAMRDHGLISL